MLIKTSATRQSDTLHILFQWGEIFTFSPYSSVFFYHWFITKRSFFPIWAQKLLQFLHRNENSVCLVNQNLVHYTYSWVSQSAGATVTKYHRLWMQQQQFILFNSGGQKFKVSAGLLGDLSLCSVEDCLVTAASHHFSFVCALLGSSRVFEFPLVSSFFFFILQN